MRLEGKPPYKSDLPLYRDGRLLFWGENTYDLVRSPEKRREGRLAPELLAEIEKLLDDRELQELISDPHSANDKEHSYMILHHDGGRKSIYKNLEAPFNHYTLSYDSLEYLLKEITETMRKSREEDASDPE
jgi:hypothetical protein